jgi:Ca2+-binding EF-hand superfamily protein
MASDAGAGVPTDERRAELQEDFEFFDADQDGLLEFAEFTEFMDGLGADMTSEECRVGFQEIDSNRDGRIQFGEFFDWWTSR